MRAGRCGRTWAVSIAIAAVAACADADVSSVSVRLEPPKERRLSEEGEHPNHLFREQNAIFDLGAVSYTIGYKACVDPAHGGKVAPLEGYLGMPRPCSCNWYHGGFLFVSLDGRDIGSTPLSSMMVAENGERAMLNLVWHDEAADVRVRFVGLPGRQCLICEIAVDPVQEIEAVEVGLRCYPSFFTAWHKRDGARRIQTPARLIQQGETVSVPADENWWAVYYDEIFDVAKGEGEGPCAMLLPPGQASEIRFAPGSYAVGTEVRCLAASRRVRLAVWDFRGRTNAEALAYVRDTADAVREDLEQMDFTPRSLGDFDVAGAREEAERILESAEAREALGAKAQEIEQWLTDYVPVLQEGVQTPDVAAEEQLLRALDAYNGFKWDLRIVELLLEL
jgi:hypothetical protein